MAQPPRKTAPTRRIPAAVTAPPRVESVAAGSPLAGATGGFYSPQDDAAAKAPERPAAASALASADSTTFTDAVRKDHLELGEHGGSADREVVEREAQADYTDPEALAAEIARIRGFRKPLGAYSQKLALSKRPGYHRHWFNDVAGRIDEAVNNGWAHVLGRDKKPIARCVGSGRDKGALFAFAMEIPEVFWLEDQADKHQAAQDRIDGLKGAGAFRAQAGAAQASDKGKFYDPVESPEGPLSIQKG